MDIHEILRERILVLDGAMGTVLQSKELTPDDFGGPHYEGCNEYLNLTRPDVVQSIHTAYLEAGADIVLTNTFGGTRIVLAEYDLQDQVHAINAAAARLAREVAVAYSTGAKPRFVAGSLGPQTKTISVTGGITFDEVMSAFYTQVMGLLEGGVDVLLIETAQDTLNLKATMLGAQRAMRETGIIVPVMISGTIEAMGTMLGGQSIEALYTSVTHFQPLSIGLNCATGPEFMTDHLRSLAALATCWTRVYPNAGLPDERGQYGETPQSLALKLARFVDERWVNFVGGCCGTTPEHIRAIARLVAGKRPRVPANAEPQAVSGIEVLYPADDNRPVFVGERTNVIGSRRFKELVVADRFDDAAEIGRAQVRASAQVLDVCLANPDRDEAADMDRFMRELTRRVKVPLMIDSTDPAVLELALRHCQGKAIVNSINLEDGEERFAAVAPLLAAYGAAVVVGCIDEDKQQGMAVSR